MDPRRSPHAVARLIAARTRAGSRPGARDDGCRLALVIEGGGMRIVRSSSWPLRSSGAPGTRRYASVWCPGPSCPTRVRGVAALAATIALLGAAGPPTAGAEVGVPVTASVSGTARSADSNAPLPLAVVEAVSRDQTVATAIADPSGHYELRGLPPREDYRFRISAPGYETSFWILPYNDQRVPGTLSVRIDERIEDFDLRISPLNAHITGRVTDLAGRPLSGVLVAQDTGDGPPQPGPPAYKPRRTTTGADGRYDILVPPGSYRMVARRPDLVNRWHGGVLHPFDPQNVFVDIAPFQTRVGIDFRLGPRPARSCWAVGGYWITGTTDRPDPSFPPDQDDSCGADLAPPGPLRVADVGPDLVGGQHMDLIESLLARGLANEFSEDGLTPPAVRLVGQNNAAGGPVYVAPTTAPASAPAVAEPAPGAVAGSTRLAVRRGRFVATTTCPKRTTCGGTLQAIATRTTRAKATPVTVAATRVSQKAGRRRTTMRLNTRGRRLLKASGGALGVTLRWTATGRAERPARAVRLVQR